jgi:hypothetical protein
VLAAIQGIEGGAEGREASGREGGEQPAACAAVGRGTAWRWKTGLTGGTHLSVAVERGGRWIGPDPASWAELWCRPSWEREEKRERERRKESWAGPTGREREEKRER